MSLIELISDIYDAFSTMWSTLIDLLTSAVEALATFYQMLEEFDARIIAMTDSCGATEFEGLPVVEAISMYRYLVGDVVFYLIYMVVLFGCLFTIFKLVTLIYVKLQDLIEQFGGGTSGTGKFTALLTKFFK